MILPAYAYKDHLDVSDRLGIAHTYPRLGLLLPTSLGRLVDARVVATQRQDSQSQMIPSLKPC